MQNDNPFANLPAITDEDRANIAQAEANLELLRAQATAALVEAGELVPVTTQAEPDTDEAMGNARPPDTVHTSVIWNGVHFVGTVKSIVYGTRPMGARGRLPRSYTAHGVYITGLDQSYSEQCASAIRQHLRECYQCGHGPYTYRLRERLGTEAEWQLVPANASIKVAV